jgi:hypothetical protein
MTPQELLAMSRTGLLGFSVGTGYKSAEVGSVSLRAVRLEGLDYPVIVAPDAKYNYANWHRVRILQVWLPLAATPWVRSGERQMTADPGNRVDTIQHTREISWGLFGMIGTETWLVRKHQFPSRHQFVQKVFGTVYIAERPRKIQVKQQMRKLAPTDDEPIERSDAPEPGQGETVFEKFAENVLNLNLVGKSTQIPPKMVNAIRDPRSASPVPVLRSDGYQFIMNSVLRALVKNNAIMKSLLDSEAMWVGEAPAPFSPIYKARTDR